MRMAALAVAGNVVGSLIVGWPGHLIMTAGGMSAGLTSSIVKLSDLVIWPLASSMGEDVGTVTSWGHPGPGERFRREPGPPSASPD